MHPVATYLSELRATRASGRATDELSYYAPLRALLNAAGDGLAPSVYCVMNPRGETGSGLPDGAFFTPDQMQRDLGQEELFQKAPSRGVMEVKGPGEDVEEVAGSEQVQRYLDRYGLVLVTNYRAFLLIAAGEDGVPVKRERFELAPSEEALWRLARRPGEAAEEVGGRLLGHLERALAYSAPLDTPEKVAGLLASYARDARDRLEQAPMEDLSRLKGALEEALGVEFREARGERFFRSTVIQTLFYGLFSSWVLWHQERPGRQDNFSWHGAAEYLRVPIIGRLFHQLIEPRQLKALRLHELMNWATAALNRVQRGRFFERFEERDAVQYFYEPFLEAFDPELRKELGVWYTPREVVRYQVARVDTALKEELGS